MSKATSNPKGAGRKPLLDTKTKIGLYISTANLNKLKVVEIIEDKTRTDIINEVLSDYLNSWENKNGPIPILKK